MAASWKREEGCWRKERRKARAWGTLFIAEDCAIMARVR